VANIEKLIRELTSIFSVALSKYANKHDNTAVLESDTRTKVYKLYIFHGKLNFLFNK